MDVGRFPQDPVPNVVHLRATEPPSPDVVEIAERAIRIAVGVASLSVRFLIDAVAETIRGETLTSPEPVVDDEPPPERFLPMLAGASFEIAVDAGRTGARAASALGRALAPWISFASSPSFVRRRAEIVRTRISDLDARWRIEQGVDEHAGAVFLREIVPSVTDAVLNELDLTDLVLERVDLGRIIDHVDIDRVLDRLDLDAIVKRVDIDVIITRVDLDAVASRLDVDAVVQRLDLAAIANQVIAELDLAAIARGVIDDLDLTEIARASTGTMATETVDGLRAQSMSADRAVSRLVDRLLRREAERASQLEVSPPVDETTLDD